MILVEFPVTNYFGTSFTLKLARGAFLRLRVPSLTSLRKFLITVEFLVAVLDYSLARLSIFILSLLLSRQIHDVCAILIIELLKIVILKQLEGVHVSWPKELGRDHVVVQGLQILLKFFDYFVAALLNFGFEGALVLWLQRVPASLASLLVVAMVRRLVHLILVIAFRSSFFQTVSHWANVDVLWALVLLFLELLLEDEDSCFEDVHDVCVEVVGCDLISLFRISSPNCILSAKLSLEI